MDSVLQVNHKNLKKKVSRGLLVRYYILVLNFCGVKIYILTFDISETASQLTLETKSSVKVNFKHI